MEDIGGDEEPEKSRGDLRGRHRGKEERGESRELKEIYKVRELLQLAVRFPPGYEHTEVRVALSLDDTPAEADAICKARVAHAEVRIALSLDDTPVEVGTGFRSGDPHTELRVTLSLGDTPAEAGTGSEQEWHTQTWG